MTIEIFVDHLDRKRFDRGVPKKTIKHMKNTILSVTTVLAATALIAGCNTAKKAADTTTGAVGGVAKTATNTATGAASTVGNTVKTAGEGVAQGDLKKATMGTASAAVKGTTSTAKTAASGATDTVKSTATGAANTAGSAVEGTTNAAGGAVKAVTP
jgi:hypothetical protein